MSTGDVWHVIRACSIMEKDDVYLVGYKIVLAGTFIVVLDVRDSGIVVCLERSILMLCDEDVRECLSAGWMVPK